MPGVSRVGTDSAGGIITGQGQGSVYCNGDLVAVIITQVAPHGQSPHDAAILIEGSPDVFAEQIEVVRAGDAASCGHTASGSSNTFANG